MEPTILPPDVPNEPTTPTEPIEPIEPVEPVEPVAPTALPVVPPEPQPLVVTPYQDPTAPATPDAPATVDEKALDVAKTMVTPTPQPVLFTPDTAATPGFPADAPITPGQPATMSFNSQKKRSRLLLPIIGGALVLALLAGGVVFGYVLPNQPANVYNTGLNRSGKAVKQLVSDATEKTSLENFKKSDVAASIDATIGGQTFSGTLAAKYDDAGANGNLVIKGKQDGQPDATYSLNFIGQLIKDQTYPTTYLQFTGFKDLGLDALLPGISQYDGKWITISADYYKSLGLDAASTQKSQLSSADITELANAAVTVTSKHLFTTDPNTALFERKKIVGKETVDGVSAFHYIVGINTSHIASFCDDIVDTITATSAYKKLPVYDAKTIDTDKKNAKADCAKTKDEIKDSQTFDMWIDAKYKLIYKLRFTDSTDKNSYVDVGQKYTGGDDLSFFTHAYTAGAKTDYLFNLKTNIKTYATSADLTVDSKNTTSPFNVKVKLSAKPFTGTIDTKEPAGAIKLEDVLKQLNISPSDLVGGSLSSNDTSSSSDLSNTADTSIYAGVNAQASDTKQKTDVNSLYSHLEEYYNDNGFYPTVANFSSPSWRKANMPNLDPNADITVSNVTGLNKIGYTTSGCTGNQCLKYTISVQLSTGEVYSKSALN